MKYLFLSLFLLIYLSSNAQEQKKSYVEVVKKLTDLKALAVLPEPGVEELLNFSSGEVENATEKQELGIVEIKPGPQQVRLEWAGEKGEGGEMRLDYLKLKKIR